MAAPGFVDLSEIRRMAVQLAELGPMTEIMAKTVVKSTGEMTVQIARDLVPVDTGHLLSTITLDIDSDGLGFYAYALADYAGYVEYGTSRMPPQPYMNPAFDRAVTVGEAAMAALLFRYLG